MLLSWGAAAPTLAQKRSKRPLPPKRPVVVRLDSALADPKPYVFSRQDSLLLAAATNDVALAQRLLAHGVEVNRPFSDTLNQERRYSEMPENKLTLPDWTQVYEGETALQLAVQRGHLALTDLLLTHGADPCLPNRWLQSALCQALDYVPNQVPIVERLLAAGPLLDSCRCNERLLPRLIGYNAGMRQRYAASRPRPPETAAARRRRRYQVAGARRYPAPLHPLRSDSVNLYLLQRLLAAGATPRVIDLHYAVAGHEPALTRYLLTHGVGVNEHLPADGRTALHLAVEKADTVLLPLLLSQGADPNAVDNTGRTPLHLAAAQPSSLLTARLLAAGAVADGYPVSATCPDCHDGQGATPLHAAVQAARPATVRLLLAAGARPNACDDYQQTPLQLAVNNYPEAYQRSDDDWYLSLAEREVVKMTSRRPEADEVMLLLLAAGASPNVTDGSGRTPLFGAVANGDTLRVGRLLRAGAHPNQLDQQGNPPLQYVHSLAVLRQMRAAGGRFGAYSSAVLLNPSWNGQPLPLAITAAALADGGDLRITSSEGNTPLHLAAADPDTDLGTVALYLEHGAKLEARNHAGWTPLTAAVVAQRPALVQLLLDAGAHPAGDPSPLTAAARIGSEALVGLLLRAGAPVNQLDSLSHDTPLLAAQNSYVPSALLAALLAAGADPNVTDSAGTSPLHRLVRYRQEAHRAELEQSTWTQPPAKRQAEQQAAAWADAHLLANARLLLTHGARPDSRNAAGESVLDALRATDTPACRQLLAELKKPGEAPPAAPGQH